MSETDNEVSMYDQADRFISLANELSSEDDSGAVGAGIRYASARYTAFEASIFSEDIEAERDKLLEMFLSDYRSMLEENLDFYIQHIKSQKG